MLRGTAERNARAQMVQCPGGLDNEIKTRHSPCQCCTCPKWHHLSANHYQGGQQCHTSRWYNHQRSPLGGESLLTPPQIKPQPRVAQVHRTMKDLPLEGGEAVANLSVAPRGVQEKASVQPPCQEGDLPSASMPSVPPPVASEGTQPQHGGWPRTALHNPT